MAELNDKLITYGNLSTFYDKLQEQGLGGNAIEDVSVLPDASANKNKLVRLDNGEKDVYAAKLLSSETITTNRLPDEQQIDKAYLYEGGEDYEYCYYYKGAYKIICSDGELNGYGWLTETDSDGFWKFYLSEDNAVNVTDNSFAIYYANEDFEGEIDTVNHIITTEFSESDINIQVTLYENGVTPIPAIYNAPESAQIGNAIIYDSPEGEHAKYDGTVITFIDVDGETERTGYKWVGVEHEDSIWASSKPASEIYFGEYIDSYGDTAHCSDTILWYINDGVASNVSTIKPPMLSEMYIPQLNAPDSEQVDNAYIYNEDNDLTFYYKGAVTAYFTDGEMTLYRWENDEDSTYSIFTNEYAGAVNTYNQWAEYETFDMIELYWDSENEIWKSTQLTVSEAEEMFEGSFIEGEYHIIKYQRTETTEVWDWQPLTDNATNDDIDAMFESSVGGTITLIRYQDAEQQALGFVDMWVNTSGETMEYDGQTYYKWVAWYNSEDNVSPTEHPELVMLTNTLDITLPFNTESSEYEYTIRYDSESEKWGDGGYFRSDYTQKTVQ